MSLLSRLYTSSAIISSSNDIRGFIGGKKATMSIRNSKWGSIFFFISFMG
jgi:hypothetical protein